MAEFSGRIIAAFASSMPQKNKFSYRGPRLLISNSKGEESGNREWGINDFGFWILDFGLKNCEGRRKKNNSTFLIFQSQNPMPDALPPPSGGFPMP